MAAILDSVFWLGGGCGTGRTTVSRAVASRLDLRLNPGDAYTYDHLARGLAAGHPATATAASLDQMTRWLRNPDVLAEEFVSTSRERLGLIVEDLVSLGEGPTVVVEGPQLFPSLLAEQGWTPRAGGWLLPTADVGERGVAARHAPAQASDADLASRNRYARDRLLTDLHRSQASATGLTTVEVDVDVPLERVVERVTELVVLAGAHGCRSVVNVPPSAVPRMPWWSASSTPTGTTWGPS